MNYRTSLLKIGPGHLNHSGNTKCIETVILNSVLQQSESSDLHQVPNRTGLDSFVNMSGLRVICLITSTTPISFHCTLGGCQLSQTESVFTILFVHDTTESSIKLFLLSFIFISVKHTISLWQGINIS